MTLPTLLKRVEEATEGSRELDAEFMPLAGYTMTGRGRLGEPIWSPASGNLVLDVAVQTKPFSCSLDAALGLMARVLPGWDLEITRYGVDDYEVSVIAPGQSRIGAPEAEHKSGPLALLAAILKVLIAQQGEGKDE